MSVYLCTMVPVVLFCAIEAKCNTSVNPVYNFLVILAHLKPCLDTSGARM
jgi:hypothetical protein